MRKLTVEPLETARTILEPMTVGHAEEMAEVLADEALHRFSGHPAPSAEELRELYRRLAGGPDPDPNVDRFMWAIRLRADRRAIGFVQAFVAAAGPGATMATLGWAVAVAHQGVGIATETTTALADWLRDHSVDTLLAGIHPGNPASAAVARRLGLRPTSLESPDGIMWRSA